MQKVACEPQVGSDMEVFLAKIGPKKNEVGEVVPCVGIFKGTKARPWRPKSVKPGYALQEDNVMCEFNIKPAKSWREGLDNMQYAKQMVEKQAALKKLKPVWGKVHHNFLAEQLQSDQAKTFGCESDFDAYVGGAKRTSPKFEDSKMRSCGGHIHLGGDFKCPDFVSALFAELFIGVSGNGLWTPAGKKNPRKDWYGLPGIFRPKPYGVEYRTPDNGWCKDNASIEQTYGYAINVAKYLTETSPEKIQQAFRAIPWVKQHEFMMKGDPQLRMEVLDMSQRVGVPV